MEFILEKILSFSGAFFTTIFFILLYFGVKKYLFRASVIRSHSSVLQSITLFLIVLIAVIAIILALPFDEGLKSQVTSLIGIVLAAVLSLSSATFIGNALAGIMLRTINNFKPGDFIQVGEHFGRISERGLFHTEIQTENRDLTTLPNFYLATNPIKVTKSNGTFISSACSLGYDVSRIKIEEALVKAAQQTELEDPFVLITELGDFSIVYKVHGLLKDVKQLLSARSRLNANVIDCLHEAGIEIVSPNFMNQRQIGDSIFIPEKFKRQKSEQLSLENKPEAVVFDKAEEAQNQENKKSKIEEIEETIRQLKAQLSASSSDTDKATLEEKIKRHQDIRKKLIQRLKNKENT